MELVTTMTSQHLPEDEPLTDEDLLLLTRLAQAEAARDPLPVGMQDRIRFALSLEAMQAELATITHRHLALARGGPTKADTVTFTSSTLSLTVMISEDDHGVRIDGWVTGGGVQVDLIGADGSRSEVSDATGRLLWGEVPHGAVHFLIHPMRVDAKLVATPTIEV